MKNATPHLRTVLVGLLLLTAVSAFAWQVTGKKKNGAGSEYNDRDTTKSRKQRDGKNEYQMNLVLPETVLVQLDSQLVHLDEQMANLNINIDETVKNALANIDLVKINRDAMEAVNKIDWQQMRVEVDHAMKEAQEQMKKVNLDEIQASLKQAQAQLQSDSFRMQFDGKRMHDEVEKGMKEAHKQIAAAKKQIENVQTFTNALQSDGLIDKSKGYRIELKNGSLYINGTEQSKEITEKYRKYYPDKDHFSFSQDGSTMGVF